MPSPGWIWGAAGAAAAGLAAGWVFAARRRVATGGAAAVLGGAERIVPESPPVAPDAERESLDVWGFTDTRFFVNARRVVEVSGARYDLSGHELPDLIPWVRRVMGIELDPGDRNEPGYPPSVPAARPHAPFLAEASGFLDPDQITDEPAVRLRHGHGHTQEEMYAIKYGGVERVPDLVVFPKGDEQVARLVASAARHDVCLIPFGGGTNVTGALSCPPDETRTIVSVDLRRMNRVVWIDPADRMACIQAGATGREIAERLGRHGFTMGHEPDSLEFSTLGGWISTHASGMKKNRYGNIEDLVLDVHAVTPAGRLERASVPPRESIGADPRRFLLGSEGGVGIITSAVVRIFPLPEVQRYGSVLFPCFEDGVAFLYELTQAGDLPASVRLVDNVQFQFSVALKPRATGARAVKSRAQRWLVTRALGYDPTRMVACTMVFEGPRREVARQRAAVRRIARRHGGMRAGAENGRHGYQLLLSIAYIRDFVMGHWVLGESFETSVPWSRSLELCEQVKRRIAEEHRRRELPGEPFVSCRVTQVYPTGVCVYFYYAFYYKGVADPSRVYSEIEAEARREILRCGGSLSHHHGVGKIRERFLSEILTPAALAWNRGGKRAVDPGNVFGSRNQGMA